MEGDRPDLRPRRGEPVRWLTCDSTAAPEQYAHPCMRWGAGGLGPQDVGFMTGVHDCGDRRLLLVWLHGLRHIDRPLTSRLI